MPNEAIKGQDNYTLCSVPYFCNPQNVIKGHIRQQGGHKVPPNTCINLQKRFVAKGMFSIQFRAMFPLLASFVPFGTLFV